MEGDDMSGNIFSWVLYRVETIVPKKGYQLAGKYFLTRERAQEYADELTEKDSVCRWGVRSFYPGELPENVRELVELRGYRAP
jgi:hypothetical protein